MVINRFRFQLLWSPIIPLLTYDLPAVRSQRDWYLNHFTPETWNASSPPWMINRAKLTPGSLSFKFELESVLLSTVVIISNLPLRVLYPLFHVSCRGLKRMFLDGGLLDRPRLRKMFLRQRSHAISSAGRCRKDTPVSRISRDDVIRGETN